jgi:LysM repeat protein
MQSLKFSFFSLLICFGHFVNIFAQPTNSEEDDDSTYVESIEGAPRKTLEIPPFQLINPDTLKLGEHDELVCDSYTALGMPYVYDALHSFNARRMDKFGGYLNVKINQGLESIRKKGFNSDVKQLYIQVNPKTLTVHWVAVVGPSEDGKCYVRVDSRGSAGGGLPAVNKQLPRMHNLYPTLNSVKLLEFNENVIKCYDWNGNRLDSVCTFVNIRQHFFKYYDNQVGNTITLEDYVAKYPYTTDGEQLPGTKKFVAPTYRTYKVKSGDSLSTIAAKYHTTVSKIKKANGLRSDLIRIGQVLKIPT